MTGRKKSTPREHVVRLKMTLPRIPDIEVVAQDGLERLAAHMGVASDKIGEAKILVTEAVINALEHSGAENPNVRVEFALTRKQLTILVRDYGSGMDVSTIKETNLQSKLGKGKNKRGWGFTLMKTLSDGFAVESGKRGTKITLTKLLTI
jgi:anti-sigma regulatory factor (Ser/Thr protein kinase)